MRAKVASNAGGHVFEERFMRLDGLQLAIAYRQAVKEDNEEKNTIKIIHENWAQRIEKLFETSFMFTNPKLYSAYQEAKEMEGLRAEIKEEEFPQIWEEMLKVLPEEITIVEPEPDPFAKIPALDPELDSVITGFVSYKNLIKEGDKL